MSTSTSDGATTTEQAKSAAQGVATTAKSEAGTVVDETKRQAARVTDEVRRQVTDTAEQRRGQAVSALRTTGEELGSLASDQHSALTQQIVRMSSERIQDAARYLESHGPSDLAQEVRSFARRRPGLFLLSAGIAGVVAGRIFRSVTAVKSSDSGSTGTQGAEGLHSTTYASSELAGTSAAEPVYSTTTGAGYGGDLPDVDVTDESYTGGQGTYGQTYGQSTYSGPEAGRG